MIAKKEMYLSNLRESGKFCQGSAGILGFLIRNTSQGIQKLANEWNSESKTVLASTACMGRNVW